MRLCAIRRGQKEHWQSYAASSKVDEISRLPSSIVQDYSLYTEAMVYEVIVINTVTRENML